MGDASDDSPSPIKKHKADAVSQATSLKGHYLVIGGTQFMGRLLVAHLLKEGCDVTILNRCKTPMPFAPCPQLHILKCDRLQDRKRFRQLLASSKWDGIIDFVAFRPKNVRDVIETLGVSVGHYVFISSDSVYMACQAPGHGGKVLETDAIPPVERDARRALRRRDSYQYSYGGNKLKCEELLHDAWATTGFPYTALRVADVIGPFDNLGCHLRLQQKLLHRQSVGTKLENVKDADHQISVAYAPDVVTAVVATLQAGHTAHGEAFNIACTESCTYPEYTTQVAAVLNVMPEFNSSAPADMVSVCIGAIDNAKALRLLHWTPTSLNTAIAATTQWYLHPENILYTSHFDESSTSDSSGDLYAATHPKSPDSESSSDSPMKPDHSAPSAGSTWRQAQSGEPFLL